MTEPVAYKRIYDDEVVGYGKNKDKRAVKNIPLYTAYQLHPRVKMTQAEFYEFKKLLSVGISTIYEAFDVIDSDRGEMDEFEQLYNRLFTNGVNAQSQSQIEFSKLWDSLSTSSPEETIEIVPEFKWFVRSKEKSNGNEFWYLKKTEHFFFHEYIKEISTQFDTKEEAELWTNPLTEAVRLPVEDE